MTRGWVFGDPEQIAESLEARANREASQGYFLRAGILRRRAQAERMLARENWVETKIKDKTGRRL